MITVHDMFPAFAAKAVNSDNEIVDVCREDITGRWSVIYFYPQDFSDVSLQDVVAMDRLVSEDVNVLGFSPDSELCKLVWKKQEKRLSDLRHTLCADYGLTLASDSGIIDTWEGLILNATFILDRNSIVRAVSALHSDIPRYVDNVIWTLEALRYNEGR